MSAIPQAVTALAGDKRRSAPAAAWSRPWRIAASAAIVVAASGVAVVAVQGGGVKTRVMRWFVPEYGLTVPVVRVISHPVNNERDVRVNAALAFTIKVRNGQLNSATLDHASVLLTKSTGGAPLTVVLKPAGERDLIVRP